MQSRRFSHQTRNGRDVGAPLTGVSNGGTARRHHFKIFHPHVVRAALRIGTEIEAAGIAAELRREESALSPEADIGAVLQHGFMFFSSRSGHDEAADPFRKPEPPIE